MKGEAKKILIDRFKHPLSFQLCNLQFLGITPYMNMHSLFHVEPMQLFLLGLSRMLKEAAMETET